MTFRLKQHNSQVIMSAIVGLETKGIKSVTLTQLAKYIFDEYTCHRSHNTGNYQDVIHVTLVAAVQYGFLVRSDNLYSREEFEIENFPVNLLVTENVSSELKRLQTRCLMKRLQLKDGQTLEELCGAGESASIIKNRLQKGVHLGFINSKNKVGHGMMYFRNVQKPDRGIICAPNYSLCSTLSKTTSANKYN